MYDRKQDWTIGLLSDEVEEGHGGMSLLSAMTLLHILLQVLMGWGVYLCFVSIEQHY